MSALKDDLRGVVMAIDDLLERTDLGEDARESLEDLRFRAQEIEESVL